MNKPAQEPHEMKVIPVSYRLINNWISLLGIPMTAAGFGLGLGLIILDVMAPIHSPYLGIFTYMIVPVILSAGLLLILVGVLRERALRRRTSHTNLPRMPVINLNEQRHFYAFVAVVVVTFLFFVLSGIGSYRAYHFTESVTFCGITCHDVMEPEFTAYQNSPHANVLCTKCHIGPGADFFVKAKLNGLYQVYSTMFDKYNRPIPAPVHNLRPAKETCYTCHWPEKFTGSVAMSRTYYAADEENTPWHLRMLLKVGGKATEHSPAKGIHWHMATANKVEYFAADEKRQIIPWVRHTDQDGNVTVYTNDSDEVDFDAASFSEAGVRTMDCIDCHNRPTHNFHSPNVALDTAFDAGTLDTTLPWLKMVAAEALLGEYETQEDALRAIEEKLREEYPDGGENVTNAIAAVQGIYARNFFPEMNVNWSEYPDNVGHFTSLGCFRCHDGFHVSESGTRISNDCNDCHTVLAQGSGLSPDTISVGGLDFEHPGGNDLLEDTNCSECHTGAPD